MGNEDDPLAGLVGLLPEGTIERPREIGPIKPDRGLGMGMAVLDPMTVSPSPSPPSAPAGAPSPLDFIPQGITLPQFDAGGGRMEDILAQLTGTKPASTPGGGAISLGSGLREPQSVSAQPAPTQPALPQRRGFNAPAVDHPGLGSVLFPAESGGSRLFGSRGGLQEGGIGAPGRAGGESSPTALMLNLLRLLRQR